MKASLVCEIYWVLSEVCLVMDEFDPNKMSPVNDGCAYTSRSGTMGRYAYVTTTPSDKIEFVPISMQVC